MDGESLEEQLEGISLLEVRKYLRKKGDIILENFFSTGKCKECENGRWQYNFSVPDSEITEEHYMCVKDCGIVSSIVFSMKYNEAK